MSIHSVPRAASRIDDDPDQRTCTIWYLRRELGRGDYGDKRLVTYVQTLVDQAGFPPPLPIQRKGRPELVRSVTVDSRWIRVAVDAWIDEFTSPPPVAAALDRKAREAAAAEMDLSAGDLRLVGGRGL